MRHTLKHTWSLAFSEQCHPVDCVKTKAVSSKTPETLRWRLRTLSSSCLHGPRSWSNNPIMKADRGCLKGKSPAPASEDRRVWRSSSRICQSLSGCYFIKSKTLLVWFVTGPQIKQASDKEGWIPGLVEQNYLCILRAVKPPNRKCCCWCIIWNWQTWGEFVLNMVFVHLT